MDAAQPSVVLRKVPRHGALALDFPDYEDGVLHEAARETGASAIVTRDSEGFAAARLRIYAPGELVQIVEAAPEE